MKNLNLEMLLNTMPLNLYWKDRNGRYLGCNLTQARFFNLKDPVEVIGKTDFELLNDIELAKTCAKNDQKVMCSGTPLLTEEAALIADKKTIGLSCKIPFKDESGNIAGLIGITLDISAQKDAEERLEQEKRDVQIALENIIARLPGHIYWMDKNNKFLGCNDLQAKSAGLKNRYDIIGKTNREMPWAEIADAIDAVNNKVMDTGQEYTEELETQLADGTRRAIFSKKAPMVDAAGHTVGLLGISFDITDRKIMEQELLVAKERAEVANHAKTEFLASMSHDVKTPLSGIIALSELLSARLSADAKQKVEDISLCGKKLMAFFENCIELSKMDMAQLQDVEQAFSMTKITEAIHALFVPSATAKRLVFNVYQDPALPAVLVGNQINIYRVILNLVGNAIKFTPTGSVELSIILDQRIDDENIVVKIIVKDSGIGIPKDKQKVIFEKLQRLTPSYYNRQEGHGIGLYIVDQYVQAMQGTVEVDSTEGVGSKFTVTIPLKIASPSETNIVLPPKLSVQEVPSTRVTRPAVTASQDKTAKKNAPHVLLVEDSPLIQAVTREMLQTTGANVDVASTGKEAINLFAPGKYSLIYMDIGLPDMDGYEVSQRLRAIETEAAVHRTPILALTAHAAVDIKTFCIGAGMQGVLSKPLSCKQAQQAFERYALNKTTTTVDGLTFLEASQSVVEYVPSLLPVIDLPGSIAIVENETRAREMLSMVVQLLDSTFMPEITRAYQNHDDTELRKALHKLLGSLCYVSTPALKHALLELQAAAQGNLATREQIYQAFLEEVKQLKLAYSTLQQIGKI